MQCASLLECSFARRVAQTFPSICPLHSLVPRHVPVPTSFSHVGYGAWLAAICFGVVGGQRLPSFSMPTFPRLLQVTCNVQRSATSALCMPEGLMYKYAPTAHQQHRTYVRHDGRSSKVRSTRHIKSLMPQETGHETLCLLYGIAIVASRASHLHWTRP